MLYLAREPDCGRRRRAIGAERRGNRRTGEQLFEIGLTFGDFRDARRQPTRGAVAFDRRVGQQPVRPERGFQPVMDLSRQTRQPGRRQFFRSDFKEQLAFHD